MQVALLAFSTLIMASARETVPFLSRNHCRGKACFIAVTFLSTDNDIKQATDDPHKNTLDGTEGRLGQKIECWGQNTAKTLLIAEKGDHEQPLG